VYEIDASGRIVRTIGVLLRRLFSILTFLVLVLGAFHTSIEASAAVDSKRISSENTVDLESPIQSDLESAHGCHLGCCPAVPNGQFKTDVVLSSSQMGLVKMPTEVTTTSLYLFRPPKA